MRNSVPYGPGLQLDRGAGEDGGGQDLAVLAAVHDALRHGGECAARRKPPK